MKSYNISYDKELSYMDKWLKKYYIFVVLIVKNKF